MRICVQKFGGTSVADLSCMKKVRVKVMNAVSLGYKVIVVLSARSGQTNKLLETAYQWSDEPNLAEMDVLLTTGEQESVALFSMLMQDAGIKARSLLSFQIPFLTDDDFGNARILSIDTDTILKLLKKYDVLVVPGFQGVTVDGRLTTLGRGGSDTSGVALAAALNAERCDIFTDVDGVYTTDPRICSDAKKIPRITYEEMLEMSSMGAKVLQIRSVQFAKKYNVPLQVLSTFSNEPGTMVVQEDSMMETVLVSGIAFDRDQARVTLCDVPDRPGISAHIFSALDEGSIIVDMIVQKTSRDNVTDMTFTCSRKDLKNALRIIEDIKKDIGVEKVESDTGVSKVSVIGVGMRNHSGVAARAFDSLYKENINILMISTSEIKISILIDEKYTELAVRTLHKAFELGE